MIWVFTSSNALTMVRVTRQGLQGQRFTVHRGQAISIVKATLLVVSVLSFNNCNNYYSTEIGQPQKRH